MSLRLNYRRIANEWLTNNLGLELLRSVLAECNEQPEMMSHKSILLLAVKTNTEPWELINKHCLGRSKDWKVDDLAAIVREYNGATLDTFHCVPA